MALEKVVFKKMSRDKSASSLTDILQQYDATVDEVATAGSKLLVLLYGGKSDDSLSKLRYTMYCKMAAVSLLRPQPERLPLTERSAYYHCLRVHVQNVLGGAG